MDRMSKMGKRRPTHTREGTPSLLRAVLAGLGSFAVSSLFLSLLVAVIAYGQRNPDAFLSLGSLCPFFSAVLCGAISGRLYSTRAWLGGAITGLVVSAVLWLLSAGIEARFGAWQALFLHLAVAALIVLSAAVFGPRRSKHKHRRPR